MNKGCIFEFNYKDFEIFMNKNPNIAIVKMDSVIGSKGGKRFLTIHFVECSLMLTFLRNSNTSRPVKDVFNHLAKVLGQECFHIYFL